MVFGITLFGWGWKIRRIRKRWDRVRERSLKKKGQLRATLLARLDQVENSLRMLEERRLTRFERARIAKEVEIELSELKEMLGMKPEEFQQAQQPVASPKQYPRQVQRR